jgi:hypothetical protein
MTWFWPLSMTRATNSAGDPASPFEVVVLDASAWRFAV